MITANGPKPCEISGPWSQILQNVRQEAVQEERRRFSNELHDVVANHLNAATLFLAAARQALPPGEVMDLLDHAERGVRECWSAARRFAKGLRQIGLEDCELATALSDYATHLSLASDVNVTFALSGDATPLAEETKLAFLRVGQEAVTNALRHAHPTAVSIELHFRADDITLKVSDDGPGFSTARIPDGIGLSTMRDRARQIGGKLTVLSYPSQGTQVTLAMPVNG